MSIKFSTGDLITDISIYTTVVSIAAALYANQVWRPAWAIVILFVLGFVTEFSGMQFGQGAVHSRLFFIYSFLEATLFHWIIWNSKESLSVRGIGKSVILFSTPLLIVAWIVVMLTRSWLSLHPIEAFNGLYEVIIALLAVRELLKRIELQDQTSSDGVFWLILTVFFYCFCTFFLMAIAMKYPAAKLWPLLHNPVNIITYWMYAFSFWKIVKGKTLAKVDHEKSNFL